MPGTFGVLLGLNFRNRLGLAKRLAHVASTRSLERCAVEGELPQSVRRKMRVMAGQFECQCLPEQLSRSGPDRRARDCGLPFFGPVKSQPVARQLSRTPSSFALFIAASNL